MAPRRSVKNVYVTNINYNNLILTDVLCPICRSILIEPVTLPCNHGFCSSCFESTVANANLVCPLCRVRIGSWLRTSKRDNKIINLVLWEAIQKHFPTQVKNKLEGNEDYLREDVPKRLSTAGEIRREYELQKAKEDSELAKEREAEEKKSKEYIMSLKEKEEVEEALRLENLKLSEEVAKKLAEEYSFDPGPSSSKASVMVPIKKQGPMDRLLKNMKSLDDTIKSASDNLANKQYTCRILCQNKIDTNTNAYVNWKLQDKFRKFRVEGEASDSNDSINSECLYFKPIQPCVPLPRTVSIIKVPARISKAATVIIRPPTGQVILSYFINSAFAKYQSQLDFLSSCKRKLPENEIVKTSKRKSNTKPKVEESPSMHNSLVLNSVFEKESSLTRDNNVASPPFYGFPKETSIKNNGNISIVPLVSNCNGMSKTVQETEDMEVARKLHQELNSRCRHSTRNSINIQYKNVRKSRPRQTTLKEIMTQSVNKTSKT